MIRVLGGGLLALALASGPEFFEGQPLVDALNVLEARGLSLIYSSELVPPNLRVARAPRPGSPREVLEQLLAPHSLGVRPGPGGRLLVVALPAPAEADSAAQQPPSFPAAIEMVTVDAVVLDGQGEPLAGLRPEDFSLREDGVLQQITRFEAVAAAEATPPRLAARRPRSSTNEGATAPGRRFALVFDEIHMSPLAAERAKQALAGFLRTGLREGDHVTVVPTGGGGWWNGTLGADARDLAAFLRHLKGLRPAETSTCALGEYDAWLLHRQRDRSVEGRLMRWLNECNPTLDPPVSLAEVTTPDGRVRTETPREARERRKELGLAPGRGQLDALAASVYQRADARRRQTLESLVRVLEALAPVRGRKSVLLVSEGFIDQPGLPELRELARASLRASAPVFFLDVRGGNAGPVSHAAVDASFLPEGRDLAGFLDQHSYLDDGAESAAAHTGGLTLRSDLAEAWRRVADESRVYYLLGYQSTNPDRDGRLRKLQIEVARPGARVRARPGYYAPSETDPVADPAREALDMAASGGALSLRLAAFVGAPAQRGSARTLLVVEAETGGLGLSAAEGRFAGRLDCQGLVVSRDTGARTPFSQRFELSLPGDRPLPAWLAIPRELELPSGTYQARIAVRAADGRVGAVEHEFVVPPSGLRISTPLLNDAVDAQGRPLPTARTRFPPRGTLLCRFEVYGATRDPKSGAAQVSARHVLRRGDGSVVAKSEFTALVNEAHGVPAGVIALPIEGAAPGRYDLSLEARDDVSGQTRTLQEPIVVEAAGAGTAP